MRGHLVAAAARALAREFEACGLVEELDTRVARAGGEAIGVELRVVLRGGGGRLCSYQQVVSFDEIASANAPIFQFVVAKMRRAVEAEVGPWEK